MIFDAWLISSIIGDESADQWGCEFPIYEMMIQNMIMVVFSAAYVYASIRTPEHEFQAWFAFVLFVAMLPLPNAIIAISPLV